MPAADIEWAVKDLNGRAEAIALRQAYYEGRQRSTIPQGKTLAPELRALLDDLTDNLCDDVVDEPVNRLEIMSWTGKGNALGTAAIESWDRNRGDSRCIDVHRNAYMAGDGYVIAQEIDGVARWYSQRPECMAIRYSKDRPDEAEVAAKCWRDGSRWRLNLYYPPTAESAKPWVERYVTKGSNNDGSVPQAKAFQPLPEDEALGWAPVEVLDGDRLPVFHFPAGNIGGYGKPALTSTVINLQDVLNKSVVDMVVAMEAHALPDRYATGVQTEIDPTTGQEKPLKSSGRERMYRTGSKEAQFGQFPQADLDGFHKTQDAFRLEIARKGYLPPHTVQMSGEAPSGLSLLVTEGRQVKRVKTGQRDFGQTWREVQAFILTLEGKPCNPTDLEIEWAPAETRDERALIETLVLKVESLGLPKRQALLEAGYDEDDVDEWMDDAEAQREAISGGRVSPPGASPYLPGPQGVPGAQGAVPGAPVPPVGAAQPTA